MAAFDVIFLLVYGGVGRAVPDFDFTVEMSELLIKPLIVTSVRKLLEFATVPLWALVWLMSELLTEPLAVVSPSNTPIVPETLPTKEGHAVGAVTPVKVTVRYWALGTPVRFTVHWFGFGPLLTDPVLAVPQLVTRPEKVKIMV